MPGEWNEAEWDDIKQNRLTPFRYELKYIFMLTRLGKITGEALPPGIFENTVVEQGRMFA